MPRFDPLKSVSASVVLSYLMQGYDTPSAIAKQMHKTSENVIEHLRKLIWADIVAKSKKEGKIQHYIINWEILFKNALPTILSPITEFSSAQKGKEQKSFWINWTRLLDLNSDPTFFVQFKIYCINHVSNELILNYTTQQRTFKDEMIHYGYWLILNKDRALKAIPSLKQFYDIYEFQRSKCIKKIIPFPR